MIVVKFTITTNGSGDYTSTPSTVAGQPSWGTYLLYAVQWIDGTLADGVDAVLSLTGNPGSVDKTLLTLTDANNDAWYYPRVTESDNAGGALVTYALQVVEGTLKLAVTDGGDTKAGACLVYLIEV